MARKFTVAITGASGILYGFRLLECLIKAEQEVYLLFSEAAKKVCEIEESLELPKTLEALQNFFEKKYAAKPGQLRLFAERDWTTPVASGSNTAEAMIICPCSSGCLSAVAQGASNNLIERAADVMIKEKRTLILVHRETPLSVIHLENMLKLATMGVTVLPASPGFYHQPQSVMDLVDFIVQRVLDHLKVDLDLIPRWGTSPRYS